MYSAAEEECAEIYTYTCQVANAGTLPEVWDSLISGYCRRDMVGMIGGRTLFVVLAYCFLHTTRGGSLGVL
jgi:hypothetical protein